jgi:hypothetical protein
MRAVNVYVSHVTLCVQELVQTTSFEVLTSVNIKIIAFCDMRPSSSELLLHILEDNNPPVLIDVYHLNKTTGAPRFSLLSPAVAYSMCVYSLVMASVYCSVRDRMFSIHSRRDFDYKIYNALHIFTSGSCILSPIAVAFDAKKFVRYTNEWVMLQVG